MVSFDLSQGFEETLHLLFDKVQPAIHRAFRLCGILLQQHRTHEFVDVGIIRQCRKFLGIVSDSVE